MCSPGEVDWTTELLTLGNLNGSRALQSWHVGRERAQFRTKSRLGASSRSGMGTAVRIFLIWHVHRSPWLTPVCLQNPHGRRLWSCDRTITAVASLPHKFCGTVTTAVPHRSGGSVAHMPRQCCIDATSIRQCRTASLHRAAGRVCRVLACGSFLAADYNGARETKLC